MFRKIVINLDKEYYITAIDEKNDVAIKIFKCQKLIGEARLVTDNVDVSCITSIQIEDEYVNNLFNNQFTLGQIVLKFLLKFPTIVRKPEFRFILDVPENLKDIILKHHFECGKDADLKNEILIRDKILLPNKHTFPNNIHFKQSINLEDFPKLLSLLKNNAYWQSHLTLDRLTFLINKSRCFYVISDTQEIIGFARVLTNNTSFASLWDVVVDGPYRGKGIGIALMYEVFTDAVLKDIHN
ncbi:MAG: GNAT family N-acetyltransferase, partial [Gammaproteobacteria bacterium]|nr:GNAT family N-acetyltransferase [Gammaproteobacteria bacterium]